jgi:beta-glucanase (GH16 family)
MKGRIALVLGGVVVAAGVSLWAVVLPGSSGHPAASPSYRLTPLPSPSPSISHTAQDIEAVATRGMHPVFDRSFSGSALDKSVWATCYPWMDVATGCTNFGNTEYEWYLPSQDHVDTGSLHLIARPKAIQGSTKSGATKVYACRSGMITSFPSLRFKYGYVSVVARVPDSAGLWSGIWLAAANEQWPPEIDILESWGPPASVAGVYMHAKSAPGGKVEKHLTPAMASSLSNGWHTFSLLWTASQITWYVDGQQIMAVHNYVPHQKMYLVADLADFDAVPHGCKGQLAIQSVEVWQNPAH